MRHVISNVSHFLTCNTMLGCSGLPRPKSSEIQHIKHLFLNFSYPDISLRPIFLYGGVRNSYLACSKLNLLINGFFLKPHMVFSGSHGWIGLWQQFLGAISILIKRSIRAHWRQKKRKRLGHLWCWTFSVYVLCTCTASSVTRLVLLLFTC